MKHITRIVIGTVFLLLTLGGFWLVLLFSMLWAPFPFVLLFILAAYYIGMLVIWK
jgi:hypothetical protein